MMRKARGTVLLTVALLIVALATPVAASADSAGVRSPANVACAVGDAMLDLNPALTPVHTRLTSNGRGTAAGCSGVVGRTAVNGVGAVLIFSVSGSFSCSYGQGQGYFSLRLDTNPPLTVTDQDPGDVRTDLHRHRLAVREGGAPAMSASVRSGEVGGGPAEPGGVVVLPPRRG